MDARQLKIEAARTALSHVEDGMRLGIGTGSTAEEFVRLLAARIGEEGLSVTGVPTSERTADLCRALGVPLEKAANTVRDWLRANPGRTGEGHAIAADALTDSFPCSPSEEPTP